MSDNNSKTQYFNKTLFLSVLLIALSTFNYGFDNQAFATTQAMDHFNRQFGEYDEGKERYSLPSAWLSLFNSLNYIGFAAGTSADPVKLCCFTALTQLHSTGVLVGSVISSRFGRRWCMFVMSLYALVTATIAVTSMNKDQIMAARVLNYVYVGMELSVIPTFQSEIGMCLPLLHRDHERASLDLPDDNNSSENRNADQSIFAL